MSKSKKIFALIAALLLVATFALGGNAQAAPPPPSKKAVAVKKISAADASRLAEKPEENLSVIDGFVWSVEIDGSVRYVDPSKVDRSITEEVVIVVEHTTAGADGNYQLKLDRDRAMSVLPKNCAKNTQGKCRWVRVLMAANNKVGYVRYVRPQSLVSTADIVNRLNALEVDKDTDKDGLLDKVDQCPNEAGPSENKGCPDKDTDKDGFVDRLDRCPAEPGVAPDGCPVKTVAVEPAPTPTAVTVPVAAPAETPKAATPATKIDDKKVFGMAAVKIGTDTTKTTVGSLNVSLLAGLCVTGTALQQNVKTDGGKTIVKPWFFCPTVSFGQATRWYPRGGEATHVAFGTDVAFLTGIRGLNASGSAYRDNMRTNGVFAGPSLWMLLTYASLFDQSFLANIGGGAGVQLKAVMGIATLGIGAGVGACRVAKPGYSPSLLAQPGAEICGKFDAYAGIAF